MKKITLLFSAALMAFAANAQISITEDFDAGLPGTWQTVIDTGICDYQNGTALPTGDAFTTNGMFFDDDACGNGADASDVSLWTEFYDLTGATSIIISFDVAFQESTDGESYAVDVWDGFGWNSVALYEDDLDPDIQNVSFDVSAFVNEFFTVRWRYVDAAGSWGWHGGVDNFDLTYTLGVDDNQIEGFTMYPNPANDVLNVRAQNEIQNVSIFNVLGQKVLEMAPNALSQEINIASLKSGIYIVNVISNEQKGSYRLIKQ